MTGHRTMVAFLAAVYVGGCASPEYGSATVSKEEVEAQGRSSAPVRAVVRTPRESEELVARVEARLREAADPVCREVSGKPCSFTVSVKHEDTQNAYAGLNGKIVIYTGLMRYLSSEDELAAVVAHEISHHAANHIQEGMRNTAVGSFLGAVVLGGIVAAAGGNAYDVDTATRTGADIGGAIGHRAYSQEEENEADYIGAYILARAGYDVTAAARIHDKFARINPTSLNEPSFANTHPSSPERETRMLKTREEIALKQALRRDLLPQKRKVQARTSDACDDPIVRTSMNAPECN